MDYLDLDLNELASKAIKKNINDLKHSLNQLRVENTELNSVKKELEYELNKYDKFDKIYRLINEKFSYIKKGKDIHSPSLKEGRYMYICNLMKCFFGLTPTYTYSDDGSLNRNLAINFYNNKEELISILSIIVNKNYFNIKEIEVFKMPIDFNKDQIMAYVKKPHYCTNGVNYGRSRYYIESDSNAPHDLFQVNKYILDNDVFDCLLNTINKKTSSNLHYLFTVYRYNDLPIEKIQALGECLIVDDLYYTREVKEFIKDNILKFNKKTLDFLESKITTDNQYNLFHWENFPIEYQYKYMMDLSITDILTHLSTYHNKWSEDQKNDFLKLYYSNKK